MKLVIAQSALVAALRQLAPVIGQGKTLPVLGCVKLDAESGDTWCLRISATNMSQSLRVDSHCNIDEWGKLCVSHAMLLSAASRFPKGELTLTATEGRLEISGGGSKIKLLTLPASEWPQEPALENPAKFHLFNAAEDMGRLSGFMATSDLKPVIQSVHLGKGTMEAIYNNGHRLMQIAYEAEADCIVPADAVTLIRQSEQKNLMVEADVNAAIFTGENWQMRTKLLEGPYMDIERSKPPIDEDDCRVKVNREELLAAASLVSSVNEDSQYEGMMCFAKDGVLTLRSSHHERGEAETSIPCQHNKECDFGMGSRNLMTGLAKIPQEEVELIFKPLYHITIKGDGFCALFGQMRLK